MKATQNISKETSVLLDSYQDFDLWLLGTEDTEEFNQFVLKVYNTAFTDENFKIQYEDISIPTKEYFHRARVCGVRHKSGPLLGTWGLILKDVSNDSFPLPIETRYNLSIPQILESIPSEGINYVFNGWRTAVDKDTLETFQLERNASIFIFDFLIRGLTMELAGDAKEYLGVAEMEKLVYKYHKRVGIPWEIIGEPLHFWNRDRYPCAFRLGEFKDYMQLHHPERFSFLYERKSFQS